MRHWPLFLQQAAGVLKPSGVMLLTFESGEYPHWSARREMKKLFVRLTGRERYWDVPVREEPLERVLLAQRWRIADKAYFNLHPLKEIQNRGISPTLRATLLRRWYDLELLLNRDAVFMKDGKRYFMGLYYKLIAST